MTNESSVSPPSVARWLLRRILDGAARSAIVGDLDEEFVRFVVPRLGIRRARRWYWRQTLMSIAACARSTAERQFDPDRPSLKSGTTFIHDAHGLRTDLVAALRFCGRNLLTSAAVVLTLAIGVAANTAMFSVVNATYFKQLPIHHRDTLVFIESKSGGSFTYPEYLTLRDVAGLRALVAGGRTSTMMTDGDRRRRVVIQMVTANYFDALGVQPAPYGRLLTTDDDQPGGAPVVVLSYEFWRSYFAARPAIVGSPLKLHRAVFTVAGIAPEGFAGTQIGFAPDLWVPLTKAPSIDDNRSMLGEQSAWLGLEGVLDRPESIGIARDAMKARWRLLRGRDEPIVQAIPRGHEWHLPARVSQLRLIGLFVVLILVIGGLNVSILLGAAVHERRKELAIRASLGAGRLRLLRQLLAEHFLLAGIAGALGGTIGVWLARTLAGLMAAQFTPGDLDVGADRYVLLFTVAVSLATGLTVGGIPALRWSKVRTLDALRAGDPGMQGVLRSAKLWWLIPGQVALGTVLLVSAGVLVKTVSQLKAGIETTTPERIWFADLQTDGRPATATAFAEFQDAVRVHLRQMPGIERIGIATDRPLASTRRGPLRVEGMTAVPDSKRMPWGGPPPPPPPGSSAPPEKLWIVSNGYITPEYFAAMALPIVQGRDFTDSDGPGRPRVAIVNETLAERAFGKSNPIGRHVSWALGSQFDIEVVGVVRDLRSEDLREAAPDAIFFPLAQIPMSDTDERKATGALEPIDLTLVMRARPDYRLNASDIVRHIAALDPTLFVDRVRTFSDEAGQALSQERLLAGLGSTFGGIALALLIVGLYGTLATAVVGGRRELGIRLALGASPRTLRSMVIGRGVAVILVGLSAGLPLSYAVIRSFAHLLYGVAPVEPLVISFTVATVLGTAIVAAYIPARRASQVDPVVALRAE